MHRTHLQSRTTLALVAASFLIGGVAAGADDQLVQAPRQVVLPPHEAANGLRGNVLTVPIGSSQRMQMRGRKAIRHVTNPNDKTVIVREVPDDPTSVLVTGREAGDTRITLTAEDGSQESYEVHVQLDVEYLRRLLQRAVPTANVELIPTGSQGGLIVAGNVAHAEDIDIIMRTAQSTTATPERVVNALRVGGVVQVQLDAVIAFVSRTQLRRMSFDFLEAGNHHNFSSTVGGALVNPTTGSTLPPVPSIAIPVPNTVTSPNGQPANFFLGVFNDKQLFYGFLQALKTDDLAKILAEPKVVALSGRSAHLLSGGEQAIPESAGLGSISVKFQPFGTELDVLPIVLGNGRIHLEVTPEISKIDPSVGTSVSGTVVPGRNKQTVTTTVEVEDGQTVAIGGLIQNTIEATITRVPVLGDLPFIGAAFSSKQYNENELELVVLVTPHLMDPMACNQLPNRLPGQETRSPDDFELFLEGIMEAPRGPREVCQGGHYVPAYKNDPTADSYPCAGGHCGTCGGAGRCGGGGCGAAGGGCTGGAATTGGVPAALPPAAK